MVQDKIEPRIVEHKQNNGPRPAGWKRPFVETSSAQRSPLSETVKTEVEFPEQDESVGEIQINFRGPPLNAFIERKVRFTVNDARSRPILVS